VAELSSDTFDFSTYQKDSSAMSFDAGLLYDIPVLESIKPKIGLSVMDIGVWKEPPQKVRAL
jgi:hypothetical protein